MNKFILLICILLQLINKIHSIHHNGNHFDVSYINDKTSQNFQNGPQSAQYNAQNNNYGSNQNSKIKILDHYIQSTPGAPTIQTIYQSTTPSTLELNENNLNQKQNLSPTLTLHSSQGVNNLQNNNEAHHQQYSDGHENSAKYVESPGSEHGGYEITTLSPGYETNTVQTASSSESSQSSSKSSSTSSSSVSTTGNPISVVHSGSPFSVQIHGNQDQSLVNQGHNNYDLGHAIYESSSIAPIQVHSAGVQTNVHGSSGLISTTSSPHILVDHPQPVLTTSSSSSFSENNHDSSSSNSHSYNSAVMSVTPTPYTISVSTPQSFGYSHGSGQTYLPPPQQPQYFVPAGHSTISSSSNIHTIPQPPPTILVPTITPHHQISVHPPVTTSSIHNIPVVTDVPVTQIQEHHGVVTKTVKVAEPGIKKQTYEIRRPAIQKQYYDIEERVVVRPAGSVVVEIDHPISKTSKGSVTVPAESGISHGHTGIVTSQSGHDGYVNIGGHSSNNNGLHTSIASHGGYVNIGGHSSNNNGLHTSSSSQGLYNSGSAGHFPYYTGYFPNICDQYNQHLTTIHNPSYLNHPAHLTNQISSTTIKPIVESTTAAYTSSPDDDTVVIEPKPLNTKAYNEKLTALQNNPTPVNQVEQKTPIFQNSMVPKPNNLHPMPHMISVGDPDLSFPPYAHNGQNVPQNELHSHPRSDLHNVGAHTLYTMQNMINNQYLEPDNSQPQQYNQLLQQHSPKLSSNYVQPGGQQNVQFSQNISPNQNAPLILHSAQTNPRSFNDVQFQQHNQIPAINQHYNPVNAINPDYQNQQRFQAYSINPQYQNQIPNNFNSVPNQQIQKSQAYTIIPNYRNQPAQTYFSPNNQNQFSQAYTLNPNDQRTVSHSPQAYSVAYYNQQNPSTIKNNAYTQFPQSGQINEQPSNIQFNPNSVQNNNFVRVPLGGIQYYQTPSESNVNSPSQNQNYQPSYDQNRQSKNLSQPQVQITFNNSSEYPKVNIQTDDFEPSTNNDTNEFMYRNQMTDTYPEDQINDEENVSQDDQDANNQNYSTDDNYSDNENKSDIRGDVSFNKNNNEPINNNTNDANNLQISAQYQEGPSINVDYQPKDNNQKKILDFILNNRDPYPNLQHGSSHPDVKSHVISAVPASKHAEPAGQRVHTRRIVVNQPIETVQIVEEQIPFTNYKQVVIQQPTVYKTANVGLKRIQTSVPVYVQHTTPHIPTFYDYSHQYGHH